MINVTDEDDAGGEGVESGELFSLARVGGRIFRGLGGGNVDVRIVFNFTFRVGTNLEFRIYLKNRIEDEVSIRFNVISLGGNFKTFFLLVRFKLPDSPTAS